MGRPGPVTVLEYEPFPDPSEETVTISARFQNENGMVLREERPVCGGYLHQLSPGRGWGKPGVRPAREGTLDLPSCDRRDREQDVFSLGAGD